MMQPGQRSKKIIDFREIGKFMQEPENSISAIQFETNPDGGLTVSTRKHSRKLKLEDVENHTESQSFPLTKYESLSLRIQNSNRSKGSKRDSASPTEPLESLPKRFKVYNQEEEKDEVLNQKSPPAVAITNCNVSDSSTSSHKEPKHQNPEEEIKVNKNLSKRMKSHRITHLISPKSMKFLEVIDEESIRSSTMQTSCLMNTLKTTTRLDQILKPHQRNESALISDILSTEISLNPKEGSKAISDHKLGLMQSQRRHLLRQYEKQLAHNSG